jgi:hypothetical protein
MHSHLVSQDGQLTGTVSSETKGWKTTPAAIGETQNTHSAPKLKYLGESGGQHVGGRRSAKKKCSELKVIAITTA